jgi:carboxypeptidase family protein/TonB-dependent receptor-like protein
MRKRLRAAVSAIAILVGVIAVPQVLTAQYGQSTGGIFGKVVDEQGGVLPGVSVIVKGPGAPITVYSDARGEFRVTNIDPGNYTLTIALQGFSTVNRENVVVQIGKNTELTIPMKLSAVAATVTVTGEAPILETKRVTTGAQISQQELSSIPTARDPWVILQSSPGVQTDRVNVAGSESGQQSVLTAHGSSSTSGTFTVDGVNLTDMSALGASANYYDFDMFQEMQVISGGSDASIQGSGAHLNMVTKRGTNEIHGSARLYETDHHFQSNNLPSDASTNGITSGNHINSITDTGAEVGGPIVKDTLWLWGSYGRGQINLVTANGLLDRTTLEDFNGKLNWQVVPSNAFDIWYLRSDKLKFGRSAGPTRPQETSWDQTLPANTWKFEDSQIIGSDLFLTAQYNGANPGFTLFPEGGIAKQAFYDADGVWHNSYEYFSGPRPTRQVKGDVSYFFNTGSVGNELKAGFGYFQAQALSTTAWPGDGSGGLAQQTYGDLSDCGVPCATITRQSNLHIRNTYYSAYLQDAITMDRLTVNLGVRWDKQYGDNLATTIQGNPTYPSILPTINYPGQAKPFTWNDWQPRVGVTYALGSGRNTVLKASYARYAEALGTGTTGQTNPTNTIAYAYYGWNDANGNNLVEPGEVNLNDFNHSRGYDPANPGAVFSPNTFASGFHAPRTDEIVAGIDHELFPAFAVGVVYTYRKFKDQLFRYPTGVTSSDYFQYKTVSGTLPDGTPYSAPVYELNPGVAVPPGYIWTNRSDYDQTYNGVDLVLTKRLSDKWMMRGSFSYNDNKQHSGPGACVDPTNRVPGQSADTGDPQTTYTGQTCSDGSYVAIRSTGSTKTSVFLNSKWQFNINGLYQLPLNFNVAGSVFGRQGYPIDWFVRAVGDDGFVRDVAVSDLDSQRYKDVFEVDLRLEKVIPITATSNVTLSADCFNITNQNTTLQVFNRLGRGNTGNIQEIQSPRIWRFGARISF